VRGVRVCCAKEGVGAGCYSNMGKHGGGGKLWHVLLFHRREGARQWVCSTGRWCAPWGVWGLVTAGQGHGVGVNGTAKEEEHMGEGEGDGRAYSVGMCLRQRRDIRGPLVEQLGCCHDNASASSVYKGGGLG